MLKKHGYGVSAIAIKDGKELLLVEIKKKELKKVRKLIKSIDSDTFVIINETLEVENGYF